MSSATVAPRPREDVATDRLGRIWGRPAGVRGWAMAVNHKQVGLRYMATAFAFFLAGGVLALFMRTQLAVPENTFLSPEVYNEFFTMHGTTMMFLFAVPMAEGFAAYFVPLMIGARDLAFPRMNAFGYWCFLLGGIFLYVSFFSGQVAEAGWFAYVPLSGIVFSPDLGMDFWLLGITFVEISALVAALELAVSILRFRAPGMSLHRVPVFVWAIMAIALSIIFAFPPLIAGGIMLELDRSLGTRFFDPTAGGSTLLWQHLFWIFGHPEVYIQFLPAAGIISMVVPAFAGRPIAGYVLVVFAVLATAVLGFGLWVHHMYATGIPVLALAFFTATSLTIAVPSGIQVFAWIATLWGSRPRLTTAMWWAIGTIITFVAGGVTGVMVGIVPLDWQVHDTFFVVAHFHYVLIGGVVFPFFAGFYYWFPKITGRLLSERLGLWNFALFFGGFHVTFFPMHIVGIMGMPRRVYTYPDGLGWGLLNFIESVGAFMIAAGVLVFVANVVISARRGREAGPNPWNASTLEWAADSPPAAYNFATNPVVGDRDPLWSPPAEEDREAYEGILGEPADERREALVTSVTDARPEAVIWISGQSILPLALAVVIGVFFVGAIAKQPLVMGVGLAFSVLTTLWWMWPNAGDRMGRTEERTASGSDGAVIRGLRGRSSLEWWATFVWILIIGTLLAAFVGSYFYLVAESGSWPAEGYDRPDVLLPVVGGVAALAGAVVAYTAHRAAHSGREGAAQVALIFAIALGSVFMALIALDQVNAKFGPGEHAYTSLYFVLGWVALAIVGVALAMSMLGIARLALMPAADRGFDLLQATALFWAFAGLAAAVVVAVVYGAPHVL